MNRWALAPRSGFGIGEANRKCKPSNLMASLQKQKSRKYSTIALSNRNKVHVPSKSLKSYIYRFKPKASPCLSSEKKY